jgi:hypothetical protein
MEFPVRRAVNALVFIAFACGALAQDRTGEPTRRVFAGADRPALTGKERLGPKWTDEQRIDNCRVPIDKRGNKPRPSSCANGPSS